MLNFVWFHKFERVQLFSIIDTCCFNSALLLSQRHCKMATECIYQFVQQEKAKSPKKKIYRSKYDPNGPLIGSTFGMHGTNAVNGKGFHELKKVSRSLIYNESGTSLSLVLTHLITSWHTEPYCQFLFWLHLRRAQSKILPQKGHSVHPNSISRTASRQSQQRIVQTTRPLSIWQTSFGTKDR